MSEDYKRDLANCSRQNEQLVAEARRLSRQNEILEVERTKLCRQIERLDAELVTLKTKLNTDGYATLGLPH